MLQNGSLADQTDQTGLQHEGEREVPTEPRPACAPERVEEAGAGLCCPADPPGPQPAEEDIVAARRASRPPWLAEACATPALGCAGQGLRVGGGGGWRARPFRGPEPRAAADADEAERDVDGIEDDQQPVGLLLGERVLSEQQPDAVTDLWKAKERQ